MPFCSGFMPNWSMAITASKGDKKCRAKKGWRSLLENIDWRTPMGMPQISLIASKNLTPGEKISFPICLRFWNSPLCCSEWSAFPFVFGIWGMKRMTRTTLKNDPKAATSEAVCSLKIYYSWAKNTSKKNIDCPHLVLDVMKPPNEGPTTMPTP